ncbi:hypothetical protein AMJ82_04235 [candidate division TA06 bacterium SM23_40]|uniref:DUF3795 domain-containing protein n=1 Tax=candidate division TA06 bacterium SM23_40 TaxID=1703774 RepID=A0A0S8GAJ2_UNCT6|nr:MAG: hypothetical protein AMJ82_04235 [candidate division TA06 bacterium SM23_40]
MYPPARSGFAAAITVSGGLAGLRASEMMVRPRDAWAVSLGARSDEGRSGPLASARATQQRDGTMELRYDSYCGLYCGACPVLRANRDGRVEEVAGEWKMKPEDLRCHGCKTETLSSFCTSCDIKKCAEDEDVEFCFDCSEFPCKRLVAFKDDECAHHSIVLKNLEAIRERGLDDWLAEQKSRWSCPECGVGSAWYEKECGACGATLYSCKDEESDLEKGTP